MHGEEDRKKKWRKVKEETFKPTPKKVVNKYNIRHTLKG